MLGRPVRYGMREMRLKNARECVQVMADGTLAAVVRGQQPSMARCPSAVAKLQTATARQNDCRGETSVHNNAPPDSLLIRSWYTAYKFVPSYVITNKGRIYGCCTSEAK